MGERIIITLSIPDDFLEKFIGFLSNVNMINRDSEPPVLIERITKTGGVAAVPKELNDL